MNLPSAKSLLFCSLIFASAACSEATIGDGDDGNVDPDAGANIDPADADPGAPDADPDVPDAEPQLQTSTIQQASSNDITPANSINCGNNQTQTHAQNQYFRVYDMPTEGIDADFRVTRVDVGIETAAGNGGSQPITVKIHTLTGIFQIENPNLTEVASVDTNISDQTASIVSIPFDATIPAGSVFVVEVFTPEGATDGNQFFIGSNQEPETQPGYIIAADCNVTAPTSFSQAAQDNVGHPASIVLNVTGEHF